MGLTWKLCNLLGATLQGGVLKDRLAGGRVDLSMNGQCKAQVALSLEDPAAALAYPLYTVLKVLEDDVSLFTGILVKPRFNLQGGTVQINAVNQAYRAATSYVGQRSDGAGLSGAVSWNPWRFESKQPSWMFYSLIQHCQPTAAEISAGVPPLGIYCIDEGLGVSVNRDYTPGTQLLKAFQDWTTVDNAVDFYFNALDQVDGNLNWLRIYYPRMGSDKSASVIFHAGWGQENATDFSWEPDGGPVVNRMTVLGQAIEGDPQKGARSDQPNSQIGFGIYGGFQGRSDVTEQSILNEYAQGAVSTQGWPLDFFSFVPAMMDGSGYVRDASTGSWVKLPGSFGRPKKFGPGPNDDFFMGDTIRVIARQQPGLNENLTGRVTDASLTELEGGNVAVEVNCTPTISEVGVTTVAV